MKRIVNKAQENMRIEMRKLQIEMTELKNIVNKMKNSQEDLTNR